MITATQFTFKNQRAYLTAIEAADIFNREQPLAPKKQKPVPFDYASTVRDLLTEMAEHSANETLKKFREVSSRSATLNILEDNDSFTMPTEDGGLAIFTIAHQRVVEYDAFSYNFSGKQASVVRDHAFEALCAFEYNRLRVHYARRIREVVRGHNVPMVYKRYARALCDYRAMGGNDIANWQLLAIILSDDAEAHYENSGTFPRTTETAFIKQMRAKNAFDVKLTASDELHLESVERVLYENKFLLQRVAKEESLTELHIEALEDDAEFEENEESSEVDTDIDFDENDE